jgi:hypothetical protein
MGIFSPTHFLKEIIRNYPKMMDIINYPPEAIKVIL